MKVELNYFQLVAILDSLHLNPDLDLVSGVISYLEPICKQVGKDEIDAYLKEGDRIINCIKNNKPIDYDL